MDFNDRKIIYNSYYINKQYTNYNSTGKHEYIDI